jgi:hypothetical protein
MRVSRAVLVSESTLAISKSRARILRHANEAKSVGSQPEETRLSGYTRLRLTDSRVLRRARTLRS